MFDQCKDKSILNAYIYETTQLIDGMEQIIIKSEKSGDLESEIQEIFRIIHTIKGNSMMMTFENIGNLTHSLENLFDYLRTERPKEKNNTVIADLVLETIDFIKDEIDELGQGNRINRNCDIIVNDINDYLESIKFLNPSKEDTEYIKNEEVINQKPRNKKDKNYKKQYIYETVMCFESNCKMVNIRAFKIAHDCKNMSDEIIYFPKDIIKNEETIEIIKKDGFKLVFKTSKKEDEVKLFFEKESLIKNIEIKKITENEYMKRENFFHKGIDDIEIEKKKRFLDKSVEGKQNYIRVDVEKLDKLMDLVEELVVSEAMVTGNLELKKIESDSFLKAARQHRKIINDLQDVVMETRMVSLSMVFQKMNRLVRDMSKKEGKEIELVLIGQDTEVDKNIIEHISDPLMHLIRNAIDHGIESVEERVRKEKSKKGMVILEAKNEGGYVLLTVKDDGRGLDKKKILEKAKKKGLLTKEEDEYLQKEIYSLIFKPGFSTKEEVTEYSGRGVGLDVVMKDIEKVGGTVIVESTPDKGTSIIAKIPLTLAIIDGMVLKVGENKYTVPITSIKKSFNAKAKDIITDFEGNEMISIVGNTYPILRLHKKFGIKTDVLEIENGILVMIEHDLDMVCIFVDALIGEQQVVVKNLSKFIKKIKGISGASILGDGSISLILDPVGLVKII